MAKKTHIEVKVPVESIRDRLRKLLVSEHSQLIADVIVGNLSVTEVGLEQLFAAFAGIKDIRKYKVGDRVVCKAEVLYTWKFNKDDMAAAGQMHQGRVKGMIKDLNQYKKNMYEFEYTAIDGGKSEVIANWVAESNICLEEEWPGEEDNDLPF